MPDSGDTYIERLCDALADVLSRAASGTKDRLAGYAANFDFWVDEADHRLRLIKEYDERFKRFREAQERVNTVQWLNYDLERTSSWNQRKEARRKVVGAMAKFITRCTKEGLIDEAQRAATAAKIS
jgi:hypothetical protein